MSGAAGGCIFVVGLQALLDQVRVLLVAGEPGHDQSDRQQADQRKRRGLDDERAPHRAAIGGDPIGLANNHFRNQIGKKETFAGAGIGAGSDFLRAEGPRQRPDQLVDRRPLLGSGRKIEPAQAGIDVIARRFENQVEKIVNLRFEPRHLRRKAEQLNAMLRGRLFLKPVEGFLAEALQQVIEFVGNVADQILVLVRGLKGRAPDLPPAGLAEVTEIFVEAGDQVGLREQRVDRKI